MKLINYVLTVALSITSVTISSAQTPVRLKRVMIDRFDFQQNQYVAQDSVEYHYSAGTGGYLSTVDVAGAYYPFRELNPMSHQPSLPYDSALLYKRHWVNPGQPSKKNIQSINTNLTINNAVSYSLLPNNTWALSDSVANSYTNNRLTKAVYKDKMLEYIYGSGNTLDTIKIDEVGNATKTIAYNYTNNKLATTDYWYGWGSTYYHSRTYYAYSSNNNQPDTIVRILYNTSTTQWDTVDVKTFTYNSNLDMTQVKHWEYNQYGVTGVKLGYQMDVQYDNNNRRIEDIIWQDFYKHGPTHAGLVKHMRKQYTYNQYDRVATYNTDHWNDTNSSWVPGIDTAIGPASKIQFEYETYWPASVGTHAQKTKLKIYPSPASEYITIEAEFDKTEHFTAYIYDVQGRAVRQWHETGTQNYHRTIPLTELPAGLYVLKLTGADVNISKQFSIIK